LGKAGKAIWNNVTGADFQARTKILAATRTTLRWTSTNRYKTKKQYIQQAQQQGLPVTEDAVQKGAEAFLKKMTEFNK
jgi:hypothetical protein